MFFEILRQIPQPQYLLRAEAYQFKTIFKNQKFYMSQYSLETNRFELREQTSYRYREALYLKKKKLLNFVLLTPDKLKKNNKYEIFKNYYTYYKVQNV